MATVTLILPLEAATVNNPSDIRSNSRSYSRGNSRSDSSGSGATTERHRIDNGAIAEQQQSNSRSDSGVTSGAMAEATA